MRTLWMVLCALARLWPGALAGCAEAGRCCPGRDPACFARGWRLDRVYGTCFCDQACRLTGDCCFDYDRACPDTNSVRCMIGKIVSYVVGCLFTTLTVAFIFLRSYNLRFGPYFLEAYSESPSLALALWENGVPGVAAQVSASPPRVCAGVQCIRNH